MVDIDKQIEVAKKKPLTAENLNYIGDLFIKKSDRQRAVAYYYEAVDKLHFAQKEKKIAIYKKIINIQPSSEKAYLSLIEILSKMGLVMEEKKYMHKLALLYKDKGDEIRAEDLFEKIKLLDPHVSIPGTFFHQDEYHEMKPGDLKKTDHWTGHEADPASANVSRLPPEESRKLIDATLEEIHEVLSEPKSPSWIQVVPGRRLFAALTAASVLSALIILYFLLSPAKEAAKIKTFGPVSAVQNDFEITLRQSDDTAALADIAGDPALKGSDIYILEVKSLNNCIPDGFALSPYSMIMLLDENGVPVKPVYSERLRKSTKTIYKMNTCGKEEAAVFEKVLVAFDRRNTYKGLVLDGLDSSGTLTLRWESH